MQCWICFIFHTILAGNAMSWGPFIGVIYFEWDGGEGTVWQSLQDFKLLTLNFHLNVIKSVVYTGQYSIKLISDFLSHRIIYWTFTTVNSLSRLYLQIIKIFFNKTFYLLSEKIKTIVDPTDFTIYCQDKILIEFLPPTRNILNYKFP